MGADFSKLRAIVFTEAGIIGSIGAITGIGLSALIILPFNFVISQKLNMPFMLSGAGQIIIFVLVSFVILVTACLIAAIAGAVKVSKKEIYSGLK
jgi:putative ABC transport system permease protein